MCCMEKCEECGGILNTRYGGMDYLSNGFCAKCVEGHAMDSDRNSLNDMVDVFKHTVTIFACML
jgi:hypothetical protein